MAEETAEADLYGITNKGIRTAIFFDGGLILQRGSVSPERSGSGGGSTDAAWSSSAERVVILPSEKVTRILFPRRATSTIFAVSAMKSLRQAIRYRIRGSDVGHAEDIMN